MRKDNNAKCDECGHRIIDHNANGKCRKSIKKGLANFVCDCDVHTIKKEE